MAQTQSMLEEFGTGGFLPTGCKYCNASGLNGYKHDADCLINVPVAEMPFWRNGWHSRLQGLVTASGGATYQMGTRCAERKLRAEFPGHANT